MNTSLRDKWVFITGASAGFGAEGALHFSREGAHVVIGARRVERLEAVATECSKQKKYALKILILQKIQLHPSIDNYRSSNE